MAKGWVKLHRQIMEHPFYEEERVFSRHEAWEYLILTANHADKEILIDGTLVMVERGSLVTSIRKLTVRWKWSNTKVTQFLDLLERLEMVTKKSDTKKTVITLATYDFYQGGDEEETTQKRRGNDTETPQKHTNKNVKNLKNVNNDKKEDKKEYAPFVFLTESEHQKLSDLLGEEERDSYFLRFASWISGQTATVQKRRSAYLSILQWFKDDQKKQVAFKSNRQPSNYERTKSKFDQMLAEEESKNASFGNY